MNDKWYGFRATHRNRWELISEGILTDKQLIMYEYLIDMADWDEKHKKTFGLVEFMPDEIARVFHVTRETINCRFKRLSRMGFVRIHDSKRSLFKITKFDRYTPYHAFSYAKEERGLPIRRVLASWDLFPVKNKEINDENEIIRQTDQNLLKRIESKVYVSFKDKSTYIHDEDTDLSDEFLANVFFGGDIEKYSSHLQIRNV